MRLLRIELHLPERDTLTPAHLAAMDNTLTRVAIAMARLNRQRAVDMVNRHFDQLDDLGPNVEFEACGLDSRYSEMLADCGIMSPLEASRKTEAYLLNLPGFGEYALEEVRKVLNGFGLSFAKSQAPARRERRNKPKPPAPPMDLAKVAPQLIPGPTLLPVRPQLVDPAPSPVALLAGAG